MVLKLGQSASENELKIGSLPALAKPTIVQVVAKFKHLWFFNEHLPN